MRITEVRKDIDELSKPILEANGFSGKGSLGESCKSSDAGKQAILLDCVKDSNAFSISIRVLLRLDNVESLYRSTEPYTINKLLGSESIAFDTYKKEQVREILTKLISTLAIGFFSEYATEQSIISNLTGTDYQAWITTDKVAQFKVRLAAAALAKDSNALALVKAEAEKYCFKPFSEPYRDAIQGLVACV